MRMRTLLLEAFAACYAFTAGAFRLNPPSILDDPWGLARMLIPASATMAGLLLRDAFASPPADPGPMPAIIDVLVAVGLAYLSQLGLQVFAPQLMLPHWAPTQGGIWGLEFLVVVRHLLPPPTRVREPQIRPTSLQELRWRLEDFDGTTNGFRKGHLLIAALLLLGSVLLICTNSAIRLRLGGSLMLVGGLLLFNRVRLVSSSLTKNREAFEFSQASYCSDLVNQKALLEWILAWYSLSLVPTILLILWGSRVYSYLVLLPISLAIAKIHLEKARRAEEIKEIKNRTDLFRFSE